MFIVYLFVIKVINVVVCEIFVKNWGYDLNVFEVVINDKIKFIFIVNLNNLIGNFLIEEEIDVFLEKVLSYIIIVLDEVYIEFIKIEEWVDFFGLL